MGYDLHITRKPDWSDEDGPEISFQEWADLVEADPDLRLDGVAEATFPQGTVLRYVNPGVAVWTAHPRGEENGLAWIIHEGGEISVKTPDEAFIAKMVEIAGRLDARVQGDDGEYYPRPPATRGRLGRRRKFR